MDTKAFNYELPHELIAQSPAAKRDAARMMVVDRRSGTLCHCDVSSFPDRFAAGDLVIFNDTRVVPARIRGRKATGGRVGAAGGSRIGAGKVEGAVEILAAAQARDTLYLGNASLPATFLADGEQGAAEIGLNPEQSLHDLLESEGEMPLPPYIRRGPDSGERARDLERYQTVYARNPGAVAAPTAGLHFTEALLERIDRAGLQRAFVTLHVGPGTFRPVAAERVEDHVMESETFEIPAATADAVRRTREQGGKIVAVGSTALRTLESADPHRAAQRGETDLFIYPPYTFRLVDALLTNFHLPCSTLLMMVCAFAGSELTMRAYREAVEREYRFYSYGDCMLVI